MPPLCAPLLAKPFPAAFPLLSLFHHSVVEECKVKRPMAKSAYIFFVTEQRPHVKGEQQGAVILGAVHVCISLNTPTWWWVDTPCTSSCCSANCSVRILLQLGLPQLSAPRVPLMGDLYVIAKSRSSQSRVPAYLHCLSFVCCPQRRSLSSLLVSWVPGWLRSGGS